MPSDLRHSFISACVLLGLAAASLAAGAEAPTITADDIRQMIADVPSARPAVVSEGMIADALNQHVQELLDAWPLMPLRVPTGKHPVYAFAHPRETFLALSEALPHLRSDVRSRTIDLLKREYEKRPPFSTSLYPMEGNPRLIGGPQDVVTIGPISEQRAATPLRSYQGMYAFWAYCHFTGQFDLASAAWPVIEQALGEASVVASGLMQKPPSRNFNINDGGPAVRLNETIGSLIGMARLARLAGHEPEAARAVEILLPLVVERLALELSAKDVRELPGTPHTVQVLPRGTASFYQTFRAEPVLWLGMTRELAGLIGRKAPQAIRANMDVYFLRNNFWHLAWTEGLPVGEMSILYPQYSRAMFQVRAWVYRDDAAVLARLSDMPWCTGDLYWIEKLTYTLCRMAGP